ncbi:BTB/POZ domain-containing protein 19-like isoform X1 [Rhopilema esculentum]|uniref:BTB/POZ domain-containing protein 19-like isoform X1 n=1 Tax=Rhopilema esculentum TaxID=499914 RepID=UPI0031E0F85A
MAAFVPKGGDIQKLKSKGSASEFYEDMAELLNNEKYSDVKFLVGEEGTVMYGHKCILATRCKSFAETFEEFPAAESFVIDYIQANHFHAVLEFIYTNCCSQLNKENVFDILTAANEKGLDKLVKVCEEFLLRNASIETVCEYFDVAVTFELSSLSDKLMVYFDEHTVDIFNSVSLREMSAAALEFVLKSNNLRIDEFDIYEAVRGWATVNSLVLEQPVNTVAKDVVKQIRLGLMTSEEVSQIEKQNEDHLIPVEQISQAWKHLALQTPAGSSIDTTLRKGTKGRYNSKK